MHAGRGGDKITTGAATGAAPVGSGAATEAAPETAVVETQGVAVEEEATEAVVAEAAKWCCRQGKTEDF